MRFASFFAVVCVCVATLGARPAASTETVVKEMAFDLFMFGQPVGRMNVEELRLEEDGGPFEASRVEMDLSLNRMGAVIEMGRTQSEVYDAEGNLSRFVSVTKMSNFAQTLSGEVRDGQVHIRQEDSLTGQATEMAIPWDPEIVGERQMEKDYAELILKPVGSELRHKVFVSDLQRAVEATATYQGLEMKQTSLGEKSLHKIRVRMNLGAAPESGAGGVGVDSYNWVDGDGDLFEQEMSLGPFKMRASRVGVDAPRSSGAALPPDVFSDTILRTDRVIGNPGGVQRAIYRLVFNEDGAPSFYSDAGQLILGIEGATLRLECVGRVFDEPFLMSRVSAPPDDGADYLGATPLAQSDDPEIQRIAREQTGGVDDAWQRALKLERWVHDHLRQKNLDVGFGSAREALDRGEGDCTEHSTLLVALLRAAGIPARSAEGLVYARSIGGFGYHMWVEAYLDGWRDLDATRPGPFVDATHLQMGASALDAAAMGDMALTMLKFIGQFRIEVELIE